MIKVVYNADKPGQRRIKLSLQLAQSRVWQIENIITFIERIPERGQD